MSVCMYKKTHKTSLPNDIGTYDYIFYSQNAGGGCNILLKILTSTF